MPWRAQSRILPSLHSGGARSGPKDTGGGSVIVAVLILEQSKGELGHRGPKQKIQEGGGATSYSRYIEGRILPLLHSGGARSGPKDTGEGSVKVG